MNPIEYFLDPFPVERASRYLLSRDHTSSRKEDNRNNDNQMAEQYRTAMGSSYRLARHSSTIYSAAAVPRTVRDSSGPQL